MVASHYISLHSLWSCFPFLQSHFTECSVFFSQRTLKKYMVVLKNWFLLIILLPDFLSGLCRAATIPGCV